MTGDREALSELLSATAVRDVAAFRRLYERTSAKLYGVILRIIVRRDLAEDILQETYLRIWNHAADYRPETASPMTWMITIARNRALDWRRQDRGERSLDDDPALPELLIADDSWASRSLEAGRLAECLQELGDEQRDAVVLSYCFGLTHDELAARLVRPVGTIKSWLRRSLARLRECLDRRERPSA